MVSLLTINLSSCNHLLSAKQKLANFYYPLKAPFFLPKIVKSSPIKQQTTQSGNTAEHVPPLPRSVQLPDIKHSTSEYCLQNKS